MSCHIRAPSPCPGHGPCESYSHWWSLSFLSKFAQTCICFCFRHEINSSHHCRPISTQSITSTDSGDSEENYVAMVSFSSCRAERSAEYAVSLTFCSMWEWNFPLVPLAESSVYLPSHEWHQQPSPSEVWKRGLLGPGLPARLTQPTQKSEPMISFTC